MVPYSITTTPNHATNTKNIQKQAPQSFLQQDPLNIHLHVYVYFYSGLNSCRGVKDCAGAWMCVHVDAHVYKRTDVERTLPYTLYTFIQSRPTLVDTSQLEKRGVPRRRAKKSLEGEPLIEEKQGQVSPHPWMRPCSSNLRHLFR